MTMQKTRNIRNIFSNGNKLTMLDPAENICGRDGRTKIYQRLSNRFKKCEQTFRMQK